MTDYVYPTGTSVLMVFHDDWFVNVLLSDGRVYSFNTELWDEHGYPSNWVAVEIRAKCEALKLSISNCATWSLDAIPATKEQFVTALDFVCLKASDKEFSQYIRS